MSFKIIKASDRGTNNAWGDVDKAEIRRRLKKGLFDGTEGVRNAIRETYAILKSDDLSETPSTYWTLPHHEVSSEGKVVLNIKGLAAAAEQLTNSDASEDKIKKAARHLARHYRETDNEIPDSINEILGLESADESKPVMRNENQRQVFTLNSFGKPIDFNTGESVVPGAGSIMGLRCFVRPGPGTGDDPTDVISLAARKPKWLEGRDEADEFLWATYRALTAGLVNPNTAPVDFSKKGVLRKALKFLIERPFLKDHRRSIESQVGKVFDTIWDEGEGDQLPGINALVRINLKAPQSASIAPLIEARDANAVSVTVWYEWVKSHPDLDDWEFFSMWGEKIDDELVRVVVTKIHDLTELSAVWDGADPEAKRIEAAKAETKDANFISCAVGLPPNTESAVPEQQFTEPDGGRSSANHKDSQMDTIKKALAKVLGVAVETITESFSKDVIAGTFKLEDTSTVKALLAAKDDKIDEYVKRIEELDAAAKEGAEKVTALTAEAELGKKFLEGVRADAVKFYKLVHGDKENDPIATIIETAPLETAEAFREQYSKESEEKFPRKCGKCGSKEISRAQTADDESNLGADEKTATDNPGDVSIGLK